MTPIRIILTGLPGSGKTTVLQETLKSCPYVKVLNYGDAMLAQASEMSIHRDALRKLPIAEQQKIGLLAAEKIARVSGTVLIDTHAMIKTPVGYIPGLPEKVLQVIHPNAIVAIESRPETILERRKKDPSRNRDAERVEQIATHQELNRSFLSACSAMTGAVLTPISNDSRPEEAAHSLAQLIQFFQPR